jgi:hypothetical protein
MIHSAFAGQIYAERLSKTGEHPRQPLVTPATNHLHLASTEPSEHKSTSWVRSATHSLAARLHAPAWS